MTSNTYSDGQQVWTNRTHALQWDGDIPINDDTKHCITAHDKCSEIHFTNEECLIERPVF